MARKTGLEGTLKGHPACCLPEVQLPLISKTSQGQQTLSGHAVPTACGISACLQASRGVCPPQSVNLSLPLLPGHHQLLQTSGWTGKPHPGGSLQPWEQCQAARLVQETALELLCEGFGLGPTQGHSRRAQKPRNNHQERGQAETDPCCEAPQEPPSHQHIP